MKKIRFLTLFTVLISTLFITSCSSDDTGDSNGDTTGNYWPMAINNQWTYKENGVVSTPAKIIGTDSFGGVTYYQLKEENVYNLDTWITKKGATYFLKTGELNYVESGTTIKMASYEVPVLKDDLAANGMWSGSQNIKVTGKNGGNTTSFMATLKYTGIIIEKEATVIVNGMSYPNVIKMSLKQEIIIQGKTTLVEALYWYAKNVGPIKSTITSDGVTTESILVSYILNK